MAKPRGVLLFPGAGSSSDHPSLLRIEHVLSEIGVPVRLADFDYRLEGRKAPDRAPKLMARVRACLASFAHELGVSTSDVLIGGRSMGGRICSMVAAGVDDEPGMKVAGLVLISYPLHPPKKPESLRVEHFPRINVPTLFVQGTKDEFGDSAELAPYAARIVAPVTIRSIDGARHELKNRDNEVAEIIRSEFF